MASRRIIKGRRWQRMVAIRAVFFTLLIGLVIQIGVFIRHGPLSDHPEHSILNMYIMAAGTAGIAWCWWYEARHLGGITPAAYVGMGIVVSMTLVYASASGLLPRILILLPLGVLMHAWYADRRPATIYAVVVLVVQLAFGLWTLHVRAIGNVIASVVALVITVARRYLSDAPPAQ